MWILGRAPINADEASVGLMAHEILRGHFSTFFWGQHYGGGEQYVVAAVFAVFGQSTFTLGLTPVLLDACAALLLWRIGRRLFSPEIGVGAALLFWIWPAAYVELSTVEYGFRWLALVCGLVVLLMALRIAEPKEAQGRRILDHLDWVALGGALGIGWWCTPEIAYFAVPAIAMLVAGRVRRRFNTSVLDVLGAFVSACLGALPWLWYDVPNGFASLHERHHATLTSAWAHLRILGIRTFPMVLGLRLQGSGRWIISAAVGRTLYAVALVGLAVVLVHLLRRHRAYPLLLFCVLAPIEFAVAPTASWSDGRYGTYFAPVIALFVVAGASALAGAVRSRLSPVPPGDRTQRTRSTVRFATSVVVVGGLALSVGAMARTAPDRPNRLVASEVSLTTWQSNPDRWLDPLIASLHSAGVADIYSGYWLGTVVDFESHATITSTDTPFIRYRPYTDAVESSRRTAWLFVDRASGGAVDAEMSMSALDPGCTRNKRGCLSLRVFEGYLDAISEVFPERPVNPHLLFASVRRWH